MQIDMPRVSMALSATYLTLALAIAGSGLAAGDSDITYDPVGPAVGKRIYLSAAYHTADAGARGECPYPAGTPRAERAMARNLGDLAADYRYIDHNVPNPGYSYDLSGLTVRGFRVRLGRGDPNENASRSNSWGSDAHVPLHSNATGSSSGTCTTRSASVRGTRQIYREGDGSVLPNRIENQLDGITPGTADKSCTITECTSFSCLAELCTIDAPSASYSETEFHDWRPGTQFLVDEDIDAGVKIAIGIDNHFGG